MNNYLYKNNKDGTLERPQHMWMRIAVFLHSPDMPRIKRMYDRYSKLEISCSSPTMFNSGLSKPRLTSCFLFGIDDTLDSILYGITKSGYISADCGGVGFNISNLRNAPVSGYGSTGGIANWIPSFDDIFKAVNQGGKRPGSAAMYLNVNHMDLLQFLNMSKPSSAGNGGAPTMFYAVVISDAFMEAVKADDDWYMFSPNRVPRLQNISGQRYTDIYNFYKSQVINNTFGFKEYRVIKARELLNEIAMNQVKTGKPYIVFQKAMNNSNQSNIGHIANSNLCAEIMQYSDTKRTASCNIATICVPKCVPFCGPRHFHIYSKILILFNINFSVERMISRAPLI
jgi:ribonucleotide reductase alpha subunit